MLKNIANSVFSFDVEWIPDPKAGEILYEAAPADGPGEDARAACETLWADSVRASVEQTLRRKQSPCEGRQTALATRLFECLWAHRRS